MSVIPFEAVDDHAIRLAVLKFEEVTGEMVGFKELRLVIEDYLENVNERLLAEAQRETYREEHGKPA